MSDNKSAVISSVIEADESILTFGDLSRQTQTSPQLINKYQKFSIVWKPKERGPGMRNLYPNQAIGEVMATNFLKLIFSLKEIARMRQLEYAIWDFWKKNRGDVLDRTGEEIHLELFFVKELRLSLISGWEKTREGAAFKSILGPYLEMRHKLRSYLQANDFSGHLRKALQRNRVQGFRAGD